MHFKNCRKLGSNITFRKEIVSYSGKEMRLKTKTCASEHCDLNEWGIHTLGYCGGFPWLDVRYPPSFSITLPSQLGRREKIRWKITHRLRYNSLLKQKWKFSGKGWNKFKTQWFYSLLPASLPGKSGHFLGSRALAQGAAALEDKCKWLMSSLPPSLSVHI